MLAIVVVDRVGGGKTVDLIKTLKYYGILKYCKRKISFLQISLGARGIGQTMREVRREIQRRRSRR
jgi:hypothetical protein